MFTARYGLNIFIEFRLIIVFFFARATLREVSRWPLTADARVRS